MGVIQIGVVKGAEITTNKNGDKNVIMLQVEITDPEDVQAVQLMMQAGEDSNPPDESKATIVKIGEFKVAVAVDDGIEPSMERGEKKLYSSSGGVVKAFINFLVGGVLELMGNNDYAVRFNALNTAIEEIKSELNSFITTEYRGHKHSYLPGPGSATPSGIPDLPGTEVTADISAAKVEEVKII